MGILARFTSPNDVRWEGPQRRYHTIFLVKNVVLIVFIILVIVEYLLLKRWWESANKHWKYSPHYFWFRIGIALVPDIIVTVLSLVLILNPLHHSTYSLHPVFALVSSLFMFSLYVNVCWLNPIITWSNENGFDHLDAWYNMANAETGFEVVLCLCWLAMMVCSCMAVHRWRISKKAGGRTSIGLGSQLRV